MSRPKTKEELLALSQKNAEALNAYIDSLPEEEQHADFPEGTMNRNIRDIIAHLHHWHLLFLRWYEEGMQGQKPEMPAPGYTWKTTPALNRYIWEKYQDLPLEQARQLFAESFQEVRRCIERHSNEELFEKKRYAWTGSTSLGAYLVSATSSHYDWGLKLIKKARKKSKK